MTDRIKNGPIVFVSHPNIRTVVRQVLKDLGAEDIKSPNTDSECTNELVSNNESLLIIDWDHGPEIVNKVLLAAQSAFSAGTRPIFLISSGSSEQMVGTATDYNVSRIHTEEISKTKISEHIQELVSEEKSSSSSRQVLMKISDLRMMSKYDDAITLLNEALKQDPSDSRLTVELADIFIAQNKWLEAANILEQVKDLEPPNLRALHQYGRCMMRQGKHEAASEVLKKANILNPLQIDRLVDLGNTLIRLDEVDEAKATFKKALTIDNSFLPALQGSAQCGLMQGDINEGLALIRQFSNAKELAALFNTSAVLSIRFGRLKEGLQLYESGISAIGEGNSPVLAQLMYNIGIAYHRWNREPEALEKFQQAYALDPSFHNAGHNAKVMESLLTNTKTEAPSSSAGSEHLVNEFNEDFEDETLLGASNRKKS